jgi:hypothetical protein
MKLIKKSFLLTFQNKWKTLPIIITKIANLYERSYQNENEIFFLQLFKIQIVSSRCKNTSTLKQQNFCAICNLIFIIFLHTKKLKFNWKVVGKVFNFFTHSVKKGTF